MNWNKGQPVILSVSVLFFTNVLSIQVTKNVSLAQNSQLQNFLTVVESWLNFDTRFKLKQTDLNAKYFSQYLACSPSFLSPHYIFPNSISLLYMVIYSLNKPDFIISTKVI